MSGLIEIQSGGIDSVAGADIDLIPRVVTSRSRLVQATHFRKLTINQVKQAAVESALYNLEHPPKLTTQDEKNKLKSMLSKLKQ